MSHSQRAQKALAHLGDVDPALAVLALWCTHRDGDERTYTSGNTIVYGASFTSFGLAEQVGVVAHHVLHVALQHSDRQAAFAERLGDRFDPELYGLAADGLVNETLLLAGHAVPRPAVLLSDLLAEIGKPARSPVEALSEWDTDRLAMALHQAYQHSERAKKYGQGQSFSQDLKDGRGGEEVQVPTAADWRNQMVRALEAGRKAGTGIGRLGGFLADLASPRIPWEVQLRGILSIALSDVAHPAHRRPARHWVARVAQAQLAGTPQPVFEPGLTRDTYRPRVAIGLDTSSSVDAATLSLFCAETEGVSRRTNAEVHLLAFDESVHTMQRLDIGGWQNLRDASFRIGGGTDYAPVFVAAAEVRPSILIMLTDLDAPVGAAPPFPVLWAVPGRGPLDVPFGRGLRIAE